MATLAPGLLAPLLADGTAVSWRAGPESGPPFVEMKKVGETVEDVGESVGSRQPNLDSCSLGEVVLHTVLDSHVALVPSRNQGVDNRETQATTA